MTDIDPEVFTRAIDVLDQMGWGKGNEICADGSVCAHGALKVALGCIPTEIEWCGESYPELIEPDGWGRMGTRHAFAAHLDLLEEALRDLGQEQAQEHDGEFPPQFSYITEFNDEGAESVEDVKQVFALAHEYATHLKESK